MYVCFMHTNSLDILIQMDLRERCKDLPEDYHFSIKPNKRLNDKTANGLERCIVRFLELEGYQAERIKNTGRFIDSRSIVTDVVGRKRTVGSSKWVPGTGRSGTSDISSTIKGRSVKWEVKIGRDSQSPAQREYEELIKRAGGFYFIVKTFDDFYNKYKELLKEIS